MMTKIFQEEGVPQQLVYLSMMESGLNPTARSWASAVGLWQFIKSTGKLYGSRINFYLMKEEILKNQPALLQDI